MLSHNPQLVLTSQLKRLELPLRVNYGLSRLTAATSAFRGKADEISTITDIETRRSAIGGKADVPATWPGSPLLAMNGQCAPTARITSGGRYHPESCRLIW